LFLINLTVVVINANDALMSQQARGQVIRFKGGKYIVLGGQDFCFYYMFKSKFSGCNKI